MKKRLLNTAILFVAAAIVVAPCHGGKITDKGKANAAKGKRTTTVKRRIIGSIVFPKLKPRPRESSALKVLTPEVLEMTKKAMEYIRSAQQADGSWGDKMFPKSTAVTAMCCMALLAEGSLPRVGYSGKQLDKGIAFILSCAGEGGTLVAKNTFTRYGPMYDHAWATFVLLMAYGNAPWYPDMRRKLSEAIWVILRAQKPDGGWRYSITPLGRSAVPITATVLSTLRLARLCGFAIPEDKIKKAEDFIIRCGKPYRPSDKGTFCYREGGERGNAATTAAGLLGLFSRGLYEHEYVEPCVKHIAFVYARAHLEDFLKSYRFKKFHFGCFFVSQAMFQAGDEYWIPWYRKYAATLKATQSKEGFWTDRKGNRVYTTAMAAIVLQAPLCYLPLYLR